MSDLVGLRARLIECVGLKAIHRTGWVRVGIDAPESVAAHAWGVAWLVLVLAPVNLDRERALSMAIVHDLAEVRTGDRVPQTAIERAQKAVDERSAMLSLCADLPSGDRLVALFEAYEAQSCTESRFVKACDRLDMALQAAAYADQGIDLSEFVTSALAGLEEPTLRALAGD